MRNGGKPGGWPSFALNLGAQKSIAFTMTDDDRKPLSRDVGVRQT
jgi:hypothetical protein